MSTRDTDRDVVILEAVRTPVGRRGGGLAGVHPADLLGTVQREVLARPGVDPAEVGQVVGGCVTQVGAQAFNVTRNAWLAAGLPDSVAATTVDAQCGSSQQAANLAAALIGSGGADLVVACGVESMDQVPIGASARPEFGLGEPLPESYFHHRPFTNQFEGAELIAERWGVTRADADAFAARSQSLAAKAWAEDRFGAQIVPVEVPGNDGVEAVGRDEGLRDTTVEALAELRAVVDGGVHTAGSSSQISDGAGAVLLASRAKAEALGLEPRARVVDSCLVGVDPIPMLTGPIDATRLLLERNRLSLADVDTVEINEAFASVVLAWARELGADLDVVNPNGGAIALGHPLGGTGAILLTKALHELERTGGRRALVTMCCGAGLGTGTLIERA